MTENTENTAPQVQTSAPQGDGMSDAMASKFEALGLDNTNNTQTPAAKELLNAVTERVNTETPQQAPQEQETVTQPIEPSSEEPSFAEQITQAPTEAPVEQPQTQVGTEAESLQDSQKPSNDSPYFIESEVFGGKMEIGGGKEVSQEPTFSNFNDIAPVVKEKFGFEDPNALMKYVETSKEKEADYTNTSNQLERIKNDINSLPPEIADSIQLWGSGDDYTKPFAQKRLNYNLEPQDMEQDKMINHYFPNELTDDLRERIEDNDSVALRYKDKLYSDSVAKFRAEKDSVKTRASQYQQQAEERGRNFNNSVLEAMNNYDKEYPNSSSVHRDKVHKALVNKEIDGLLYNPDGTYTNQAATFFIEMTQGKNIRNQFIRQAEERAASKANEEIISRQSGTPRLSNGGAPSTEISEAAKQHIESITKGGELNKNFY